MLPTLVIVVIAINTTPNIMIIIITLLVVFSLYLEIVVRMRVQIVLPRFQNLLKTEEAQENDKTWAL